MAPYEKKNLENMAWATIQKQTKRGSSKIVSIGALSADVFILAAGVSFSPVTGSGKIRKMKNTVYRFQCYKTPNGSKKKREIKKRVGFNTPVLFGGPRSAIHRRAGGNIYIYISVGSGSNDRFDRSIARSTAGSLRAGASEWGEMKTQKQLYF